jgi:hypothetical protein
MTWRPQNLWKIFQRIAFDLQYLGGLGQDLRLFLRKDDVSLHVFLFIVGAARRGITLLSQAGLFFQKGVYG